MSVISQVSQHPQSSSFHSPQLLTLEDFTVMYTFVEQIELGPKDAQRKLNIIIAILRNYINSQK
jgi:hypothetical protein